MKNDKVRWISENSQIFGNELETHKRAWGIVLRQAVSKGFVAIDFIENEFQGLSRIYRKYHLSSQGRSYLASLIEVYLSKAQTN